jgi:GDP-4-dehydro-6-deoxy-D-mannose reductase
MTTLFVLSGANGFLGSRIKFALSQEKSNYYCLGRVSTVSVLEEIKKINLFIKQKKIFKNITLIHLAGITEHSKIHLNEEKFVKDSIDICNGISQIKSSLELPLTTILPSSGKVYGSSSYSISEEYELNPRNILGEIKLIIEGVFRDNKLRNETLIIARIFNVYGPNQKINFLVPTIIKQLLDPKKTVIELGNLSDIRDYLFIDDVVKAMLILSKYVSSPSEISIINIGSGTGITAQNIATKLIYASKISKSIISVDYQKRFNETEVEVADISKLVRLGWGPKVSIDEGLMECLKSFNRP